MVKKALVCKRCGKSFEWEQGRGGMPPRYCSDLCSKHYHHPECVCQQCGKVYRPKETNRTTYCSRACAYAHRQVEKEQRKADREAGIGATCPMWYVQCAECGRTFIAPRRGRTICSPECERVRSRRRYRLYATAKKGATPKTCRECGQEFSPVYGNKHRGYCSNACSRRYNKHISQAKRRAVEKGLDADIIDPIEVFRAARWRCYICGEHTPRKLRGTLDDRAPELEHIIPLSKGGTHTRDNVACACRVCNQAKRDRLLVLVQPKLI